MAVAAAKCPASQSSHQCRPAPLVPHEASLNQMKTLPGADAELVATDTRIGTLYWRARFLVSGTTLQDGVLHDLVPVRQHMTDQLDLCLCWGPA